LWGPKPAANLDTTWPGSLHYPWPTAVHGGPMPGPWKLRLAASVRSAEAHFLFWVPQQKLDWLGSLRDWQPLLLAPETAQGASLEHQSTPHAPTTHTDVTDENWIRDSSDITRKPSKSQRAVDRAESSRAGRDNRSRMCCRAAFRRPSLEPNTGQAGPVSGGRFGNHAARASYAQQ
jgi:hypothetical protein